jgi:hypothetical protein
MKKRHFGTATLAIVVLCATVSLARRYDRERTVRCESQSGRYTYCRTYTTGIVELRQQLSKTPCRQYDTWGSDRDGGGVWVRNGCRAVFAVRKRYWGGGRNDDRYGGTRIVRCGPRTGLTIIATCRPGQGACVSFARSAVPVVSVTTIGEQTATESGWIEGARQSSKCGDRIPIDRDAACSGPRDRRLQVEGARRAAVFFTICCCGFLHNLFT